MLPISLSNASDVVTDLEPSVLSQFEVSDYSNEYGNVYYKVC